ncbi:hypothetical protein JM83_2859 [Gillisia sp. Hel_I_86]|nr:hypothetical protein JM83_2859 [Gillisia sp. Hel_I_86]
MSFRAESRNLHLELWEFSIAQKAHFEMTWVVISSGVEKFQWSRNSLKRDHVIVTNFDRLSLTNEQKCHPEGSAAY